MKFEVIICLSADLFKWEPVIRQFIKIGNGIIVDQNFVNDEKELKVSFLAEVEFKQFMSNLDDIRVGYTHRTIE